MPEAGPDNCASGDTRFSGLNYAGDCASSSFAEPYACKNFDGFYDDCHTTPGDGKWPNSKTYREVITTFVSQ